MTTLNTIIEEEKKTLNIDAYRGSEGGMVVPYDTAIDILTTAMQRAYEAGQSEERARIRESFDDWFKNSTQDVEDWADRNLPTSQGQISR